MVIALVGHLCLQITVKNSVRRKDSLNLDLMWNLEDVLRRLGTQIALKQTSLEINFNKMKASLDFSFCIMLICVLNSKQIYLFILVRSYI